MKTRPLTTQKPNSNSECQSHTRGSTGDASRNYGFLFAAVSAAGFGIGPVIAKPLLQDTSLLTVLAWRFLVGSVICWVVVLASPKTRAAVRDISRRQLLQLMILAVLIVLGSSTSYFALRTIPAALVVVIAYTYPAMVAAVSVRMGARLEGARAWFGLLLALVGTVLAVGGVEGKLEMFGLLVAVMTPVLTTLFVTLQSRLAGERQGRTASERLRVHLPTESRHAEVPPELMGAIVMTLALVAFVVAGSLSRESLVDSARSPDASIRLVLFGISAGAVAIPLSYAGISRSGAALASIVSTLEVVVVTLTATAFLGETLAPLQILGFAFVIGSVFLVAGAFGRSTDVEHQPPLIR